MKKLWFRRRAVSTMIGGIIVLGLFLTALAAMILVTHQYDSYQQTVNSMKQTDMDRFSENLGAVPPALVAYANNPVSCAGGPQCNAYTLMISNLVTNGSVNVGVQIARIYVNSTQSPGCTKPCVLNPSTSAAPYTFQASQRYVNPGEFQHNVTLWFPSSITLPDKDSKGDPGYGLNTVSIATTRGRQFSFLWPIPPRGGAVGVGGGQGGTGIYIGPLVITFQMSLIGYSTPTNPNPIVPIGGTNGYWVIPPPTFILYIKIETDVGTPSDVYLTAQSVLELAKFDNPGFIYPFFVVAPISLTLCGVFYSQDPTIICNPDYGYYATGNDGNPDHLQSYNATTQYGQACDPAKPYSSCPNRYKIPRPTFQQVQNNKRGNPVVVAFAAGTISGDSAQNGQGGFNPGRFVTSYLGLTYVYNDQSGAGTYWYAVTLPFIAICIDNAPSTCGI